MAEKQFTEDEDLITLANKVIDKHKLDHLNGIKIKFVLVSPHISKTCAGKCIKPNAELKYFGDFDFLIEFSEDLWFGLNDDVKELLMLHELKHIHITTNKNGDVKYSVTDHDVKDFYSIIEKHGIDWLDKIRHTAASIYDFQDGQQDKMKL